MFTQCELSVWADVSAAGWFDSRLLSDLSYFILNRLIWKCDRRLIYQLLFENSEMHFCIKLLQNNHTIPPSHFLLWDGTRYPKWPYENKYHITVNLKNRIFNSFQSSFNSKAFRRDTFMMLKSLILAQTVPIYLFNQSMWFCWIKFSKLVPFFVFIVLS